MLLFFTAGSQYIHYNMQRVHACTFKIGSYLFSEALQQALDFMHRVAQIPTKTLKPYQNPNPVTLP